MFKDIDIKFVDKEITPFGGLSLFLKMVERCGFEEVLRECGLPEQGSNRGYKPWQLIMGLYAGVWCGASKFGHLDLVRYDRVLINNYTLDFDSTVTVREGEQGDELRVAGLCRGIPPQALVRGRNGRREPGGFFELQDRGSPFRMNPWPRLSQSPSDCKRFQKNIF